MDEVDLTQTRTERELELRLAALRRRPPALPDTGCCHWCGHVAQGGRRFCDADCRDDWERAHERRRRA